MAKLKTGWGELPLRDHARTVTVLAERIVVSAGAILESLSKGDGSN